MIGAVGIGRAALENNFQQWAYPCLPSDFPKYPGVAVTSQKTYFGMDIAPGNTKECTTTLASNDDVAPVTAFYSTQLSSGDWTLDSFDRAAGQLKFHRTSRPASVGVIDFLGRGQHTEIQILYDSSRLDRRD